MELSTFSIRMLGEFSIQSGALEINDKDNRSRKIWLLLAYMIYCRNQPVSQDKLISLLWGEETENSANPANALKTMFHRARTLLDQLGDGVGHTLILRRAGSYVWNPDIPFHFDVEDFEQYCREASEACDPDRQLEASMNALALYKGDFLAKLSTEPWVVPISAYYHNLYVQTIQNCLPLLQERERFHDIISLCRRAVEIEPFNESLYQYLMRALVETGEQREAVAIYETMSELLFSNFGIMPSEESRAIHRDAVRIVNDHAVSLGMVREQLRESEQKNGALFCDYDFFRIIYHAEARAVARSGDAVHICLISITDHAGNVLAKRSLDCSMENLQETICSNLRKGDIASRCSVSQFILMLPQANYENSCMVCERIIRAFNRQYPHSPAKLHFSVQPLEPNA